MPFYDFAGNLLGNSHEGCVANMIIVDDDADSMPANDEILVSDDIVVDENTETVEMDAESDSKGEDLPLVDSAAEPVDDNPIVEDAVDSEDSVDLEDSDKPSKKKPKKNDDK